MADQTIPVEGSCGVVGSPLIPITVRKVFVNGLRFRGKEPPLGCRDLEYEPRSCR